MTAPTGAFTLLQTRIAQIRNQRRNHCRVKNRRQFLISRRARVPRGFVRTLTLRYDVYIGSKTRAFHREDENAQEKPV